MKRFLKISLLLAATMLAALPTEAARRNRRAQAPAQQPVPVIHVTSAPETKPVSAGSARPVIQVGTAPAAPAATPAAPKVVREGEYTDRDHVCWYIVAFGALPRNFITKNEARRLGWQGGPLEPYAPGKSIGGDRYGNYERTLPEGRYRECDIDTRGRPRGAKRIVFSDDRRVYYSDDHYRTFRQIH